MPERMQNYLLKDFEKRKSIHPVQLQKLAYENLPAARSVRSIKVLYPDEPLFDNLKSFD